MSIENNIARIADALETLVAAVNSQTQVQADPMVSALQAIAKVIEVKTNGTVSASPAVPVPPVVAAPAPVSVEPVSAPVVNPVVAVPFTDNKGLVAYMMDSYKTLGPIKGAEIQGVLSSVGKTNINEITPDLYATVYAAVEALKAGA